MIINDPVYGFISIPRGLLCEIIDHPYFQRLGRIRQLGMAQEVYPGAVHTRKQHSLGAFHLMQEALRVLMEKGEFVFESEMEAAEAAILLHDVGHGPFSHVLEKTLIPDIPHEEISLRLMEMMNREMRGELSLAVAIYRGDHPKPWLHELMCSQLDVDRLDYLCRDSFYTGVIEGHIGAARIIKMLEVADGHLAVDAKGIYSIENYLMARRLMYWQVYLHKTAVAAEQMLRAALDRARELALSGDPCQVSASLDYFLRHPIKAEDFADGSEAVGHFTELDDSDIVCAMKTWQHHPDPILSLLAKGFTNRQLFKVEVIGETDPTERYEEVCRLTARQYGLSQADLHYFVTRQRVCKEMYATHGRGIRLIDKQGGLADVAEVSNVVRGDAEELSDHKTYLIHPPLV